MCSSTPRSRFSLARLCGIPLFAAIFSAPAAGQCYYTWEQIPNPPGWWCSAQATNNLGHVAGYLQNWGENRRGFIWTPETGTRMLPLTSDFVDMQVLDINDLDHVVGIAVSQSLGYRAFFWDGASYTIIPPRSGVGGSGAYGINNLDQVVGSMAGAFMWENGVITDLRAMIDAPDGSVAKSINDRSEIAGYAGFGVDRRAFVIQDGKVRWLPTGDLPLNWVFAEKLSNNGFTVGSGHLFPPETPLNRGIVWTQNSVDTVLPPVYAGESRLLSVNDAGRSVGFRARYNDYRPLVWQNGVATELATLIPSPPTWMMLASDINRLGQITIEISAGSVVLHPVWLMSDVTGDCHVTLDDLMLVLTNFGAPQGTFPRGDVNLDGQVDLADLSVLLSHWGE